MNLKDSNFLSRKNILIKPYEALNVKIVLSSIRVPYALLSRKGPIFKKK